MKLPEGQWCLKMHKNVFEFATDTTRDIRYANHRSKYNKWYKNECNLVITMHHLHQNKHEKCIYIDSNPSEYDSDSSMNMKRMVRTWLTGPILCVSIPPIQLNVVSVLTAHGSPFSDLFATLLSSWGSVFVFVPPPFLPLRYGVPVFHFTLSPKAVFFDCCIFFVIHQIARWTFQTFKGMIGARGPPWRGGGGRKLCWSIKWRGMAWGPRPATIIVVVDMIPTNSLWRSLGGGDVEMQYCRCAVAASLEVPIASEIS